ncbi:hypothetical protein [Paludibacterium yongneupense]|uniref:hypothetical protein n=1 Tax=Paludibacterium yongneupense TaxID=400061 RepID=UPI0004095F1A|nr:hypothetical protein [Paludibacterium yongneupense]
MSPLPLPCGLPSKGLLLATRVEARTLVILHDSKAVARLDIPDRVEPKVGSDRSSAGANGKASRYGGHV